MKTSKSRQVKEALTVADLNKKSKITAVCSIFSLSFVLSFLLQTDERASLTGRLAEALIPSIGIMVMGLLPASIFYVVRSRKEKDISKSLYWPWAVSTMICMFLMVESSHNLASVTSSVGNQPQQPQPWTPPEADHQAYINREKQIINACLARVDKSTRMDAEHVEAYIDNNGDTQMVGTPQAIFDFKRCMSENGF